MALESVSLLPVPTATSPPPPHPSPSLHHPNTLITSLFSLLPGWGFGGGSIGIAGLGAGGGCGIGVGLGWGIGVGIGTEYINVSPEFLESKEHRPNVFQHIQYAFKRISTLATPPPAPPKDH